MRIFFNSFHYANYHKAFGQYVVDRISSHSMIAKTSTNFHLKFLLSFTDTLNITPSDMSLLTVHSAPFLLSDHCSSIRSSSVSSSLSELASSSLDLSSSSHDTLNLEDIKIQLSQCCLTCGVCWKDEHFSFDCSECGGYSLLRPCQTCGGTCGALWSRDFAMVSGNVHKSESENLHQRYLITITESRFSKCQMERELQLYAESHRKWQQVK